MAETPNRAGHVGARVTRREDPRMVTGRARYLDDFTPPGTLHLQLVRAQIAHARLLGIEASALREAYPDALLFTGADTGE